MSLLTTILGWFGLYKEKKKADYYDAQKDTCWYWRKDRLFVCFEPNDEILAAVNQWAKVCEEIGIQLIADDDPGTANILIAMEDAVARGGVTTRVPAKGTVREIAWVKISIAKHEKGKRLLCIALHELGHGLGLTHDGVPKGDVMHSDATATSISDAAKNTIRKIYENLPA